MSRQKIVAGNWKMNKSVQDAKTLVEMITGRKPSDKFMEYAQMVGMVLLLGLMAYALGLDFLRLFK